MNDALRARRAERARSEWKQRVILQAERRAQQRELDRIRGQQAQLRAAFYERHPDLNGAA